MTDLRQTRSRPDRPQSPRPPTSPPSKPSASRRWARPGSISELLKSLGAMSPDERRERGPADQRPARPRRRRHRRAARRRWRPPRWTRKLAAERVDLTLPPPPRRKGRVHPTMQVMDEMIAIFAEMGFAVAEGPDIEDDFHNFTALNFPPKHPAREMHDTFFFNPRTQTGERKLLRTHTSPVQVRTMQQANALPAGSPGPGAADPHHRARAAPTARTSDQTHTPMFHQIEGLVIDRDIHMGHLKWTLDDLHRPLLRDRRGRRPASARTTSRSPSLGRDGRAVRPLRRRGEDRPGRRLAGDRRLRDGAPQRAAQLRPRPGRMAGLRLRLRRRPAGRC